MRRRRNRDVIDTVQPKVSGSTSGRSVNPSWHPIVRQLFMSYSSSPQSTFFEPSDWAQLNYVCEFMSASLYRGEKDAEGDPSQYKIGLDNAASIVSALEDFMTTEATRRRLRVSIDPSPTMWGGPLDYWHPIAVDWYKSLKESGQSMYYQPTDVAFAVFVAELIHRHVSAGLYMNGKMMATVTKACSLLLTTESARRLAQMELAKAEDKNMDAEISAMMERYAESLK